MPKKIFPTTQEKINPLILGVFIAITGMLVYFLFVGHPVWGTNDDVGMSMIAAGVWLSSQPSGDLLFIHPFYGQFISHLYMWQPEVPWYGVAFIIIIGLSLAALNYSILRLRNSLVFCFFVIGATLGTVLPVLWHLQFTIVGGLAALAGSILLFSFFIYKPTTKKVFIVGVVTSLCLLLLGAMIRFESMLMVCALVTLYTIILFFKFIQSAQYGKFYGAKFLLVVGIISIFIIGLKVLEYEHYEKSHEWTEWFLLNKNKSEFMDYRSIKYTEKTHDLFSSVGWSLNDYNMIMSWQYLDPIKFSPKKFAYVTNEYKKNAPSYNIKHWQATVVRIINDIKSRYKMVPTLFFCIFIISILTVHWSKWNLLYVSSILCTTIVILLYLYFGLNRAPFRVLVLLWISILWMMLLISTKHEKCAKIHVWHFRGYKTIISAVLLVMFSFVVYKDFVSKKNYVDSVLPKFNHLEHFVKVLDNALPNESIIYSIGTAFPYERHLPLKTFAYLYPIKGFVQAGAMNQSPLQRQVINDLGLSSDFYGALAKKKHVYALTKGEVGGALHILRIYYKENYDLELYFTKAPNHPFLYQLKFN